MMMKMKKKTVKMCKQVKVECLNIYFYSFCVMSLNFVLPLCFYKLRARNSINSILLIRFKSV